MGNRDAIVAPDLKGMAERVLAYFSSPNMTLEFILQRQKSYSWPSAHAFPPSPACCEISEKTRPAPRAATGAWHLAVLAAASLVFDVAIGEVRLLQAFCRLL